ncbi:MULTISPECIES: 16S rRNA (guanine(527)-N(7))-methyltransferase RsmG [unclassified Nocardioides]|uniref:Ribosomal RNA small subunit methyltransferase G n=1 Tax=Nocardioides sp. (strain ATCC BAA-499 / JS614) TaxID=196162 RepID=RSMG_NOCSJ|nr:MULTISPECIES: 16S rRNA (guanine(527)-N(7))-methyltransferase RsmG [unclassified Nocardioides]A1SQV5.1 RecName: Full=Ribosomal RNA small subunit methyltransferase G; AltName: Full=16S rRNA 7-methylguanosine methyltransferase; Short=16S rRNA m7G methyltransferase [Nocardioides sp. JS614]ABL84190.1 16S rRNA m(7)G-527 methyltransferase [Nocardioides sp. JS614]
MTDDVSRETPSVPDVARRVFASDRLSLAERFVELLAGDGVVRGLIGPRETPRLWDRHLLNCALLAQQVPLEATVADLGSGAGLPGVVLAIARPDLRVTLVEPLLRRTTFLEEVVAELGLDRVEVLRARAEALHGDRRFAVVTSRALAPLDRLLGWSMPLVEPTGALLAMKGSAVAEEITAAGPELARWGCATPEVLSLGADLGLAPTVAVRVVWADPGRVSWPIAAPRKRGGQQRRAGHARGTSNRRRGT